MTALQLQTNSNDNVKTNCVSSPTSWPYAAESPSEMWEQNSKRRSNSHVMPTLLCCPALAVSRAVSCQRGVRRHWGRIGCGPWLCCSVGYSIKLCSLCELARARCSRAWLHGGSWVPFRAEMGFLTSDCCCVFPFSCPLSAT